MKIKVISKKINPLLKRKEILFELDHSEEGETPSRMELRKELSGILKTKLDMVFIEKVETKTGTTTAIGQANTYESTEQAKLVERDHIIARNTATGTSPAEEKQEIRESAPKEQTMEASENSGLEGESEATGTESEEEKEK